jgi:hypothetical protein
MGSARAQVADAIDIETFFICRDAEEAQRLAMQLAEELNLPDASIVFLEYAGLGARVRLRSYVHRPGEHYGWLESAAEA